MKNLYSLLIFRDDNYQPNILPTVKFTAKHMTQICVYICFIGHIEMKHLEFRGITLFTCWADTQLSSSDVLVWTCDSPLSHFPLIMSLDVEKHREGILRAFNDVVSDKKSTDW